MFDPADELANLRQHKAALRRKRYNASKLTPYRAELVALRQAGASYRELAAWLRRRKRRQVHATTIRHYLLQLPELSDNADLR